MTIDTKRETLRGYFSAESATPLHRIPAGGHVHVIGISGVAMAQISVALTQRGLSVSGSDVDFWEPMGSLLRRTSISLRQGYAREHVPERCDLVVIGNAISFGNAEVDVIAERRLPFSFFPKLLREVVIGERHSIVVSGTHGKTTTTALGAWTLRVAGRDPSYFAGGVVHGLEESLHVGSGDVSIVEGDEYDSAFFAKVPKFSFYAPCSLVVTAIEYDHADIYPTLESIEREFTALVKTVPSGGVVYACVDCPNVRRLLSQWRSDARAQIRSYGVAEDADLRIVSRDLTPEGQVLTLREGGIEVSVSLSLGGAHNARNATALFGVLSGLGLSSAEISKGFASFQGVRRRQEVRADHGEILLIEDFAHHPTAVKETVRAVNEKYPGRRVLAVFEPRSNTSRRKVFYDEYLEAFQGVGHAYFSEVVSRAIDAGQELLSVSQLASDLTSKGIPAEALPTTELLEASIMGEARAGDVVLVMSNGSFGGLLQRLAERIEQGG